MVRHTPLPQIIFPQGPRGSRETVKDKAGRWIEEDYTSKQIDHIENDQQRQDRQRVKDTEGRWMDRGS
jgi:hypothetical protein